MKSLYNFPVDITSLSQITSDQRLIRFQLADQKGAQLSEDNWTVICVLDTDEEMTFYVGLSSDRSDGTEQQIEVMLVVNRWHGGPRHDLPFAPLTVSS